MHSYIRRGFTLVEVLIVIVIVGILAAIVVPQFTGDAQVAIERRAIRSVIEINSSELQNAETMLAAVKNADAEEYKRTRILELEAQIEKLRAEIKAANQKLGVVEETPHQ